MLAVKDQALARWTHMVVARAPSGETMNVFVGYTRLRGPTALAGKEKRPITAIRAGG